MAFFAEHGFPPGEFRRFALGPVVRKDEVEYFHEVGLHDTVTVTYAVTAMSADGARFVIENEIWSATGERAATVRSTGGWLDLRARKLIAPPEALLLAFQQVPRAPGFVELPTRSSQDQGRQLMDRRNVAIFLSILCIGVALAANGDPPNANAAVVSPTVASDSDEIALGAALVKQFDIDRGIEASKQSRAIEAYLQRVADSLGRHPKRKLPWRIHYDSHPAIKSGFALPGGHIVIWGGALAYMSKEDEVAAIIAHEMEHTEEGQVNRRIDSLVTRTQRSVANPEQWNWREFGATYGETLEKVCDFEGAKLMVKAGYSPLGLKMLLQSFIALGIVHAPTTPPSRVIVDRVDQIDKEIVTEHWEALTTMRPIRLP